MANNNESSRAGPKDQRNLTSARANSRQSSLERQAEARTSETSRRRSAGPEPLHENSPSKLDSTIESILRKKVRQRMDTEKIHSGLLARIQFMDEHAVNRTIPSGLRIKNVKAKGQNLEDLQAKFDEIVRDAELKLLKEVIQNLRTEVTACAEAVQQCRYDIDGTIAQWKASLLTCDDIPKAKVDSLVEAATQFVETHSCDCATARASKALLSEISQKEKTRRSEGMDTAAIFVPSEESIREIIRKEIQRSDDTRKTPKTSNRQRKVSLVCGDVGKTESKQRQSRPKQRQGRPQQRQTRPKQRQSRSPKPRSSSSKRVNRPRSASKNARGKGSGPAK